MSTPIRSYTKSQLANLYEMHVSTFSKMLNTMYLSDLTAADYTKAQKILTPRQVHIIFDKIGAPED